MWLLFVPLLIVVVVACSRCGRSRASLFWLLGSTWPWLLIALGAWMFWHEDGRHRHRQRRRAARLDAAHVPPPIHAPPTVRSARVERIEQKADDGGATSVDRLDGRQSDAVAAKTELPGRHAGQGRADPPQGRRLLGLRGSLPAVFAGSVPGAADRHRLPAAHGQRVPGLPAEASTRRWRRRRPERRARS